LILKFYYKKYIETLPFYHEGRNKGGEFKGYFLTLKKNKIPLKFKKYDLKKIRDSKDSKTYKEKKVNRKRKIVINDDNFNKKRKL